MIQKNIRRRLTMLALLVFLLCFGATAFAQTTPTGRLDFLKSKDSSFALFANTSATFQPGKQYPNELVLVTGLPSNPAISARVDLGAAKPQCPPGGPCGGIRNVALSPDGDTALVSSDPSDMQAPATRGVSSLFLLRNVRAFARSRNPSDLRVRAFKATDFPQLDNVSGLAFGPDGRWAVVNTIGPGPIDLTYQTARGTLVLITGLPDNPVFSAPIPVPMHSQGNIDLSLDGGRLLLNDTTDRTGGFEKSSMIVMQGIRPGGPLPRVIGTASIVRPEGIPAGGPSPIRDARLSADGRFILAPIPLIRAFDAQQMPVAYDQIAILGPVRNGKLDSARVLTQNDGVNGGPNHVAVSPDGDSALVVNTLDIGGAKLLAGLGSGVPSQFQLKTLPFPFFGPPFPMGPNGPPALAAHVQAKFTPDGETAVVANWIIPPLATAPLSPSLSVLTGFQSGNIRVVTHLTDPALNTFDYNQQIATVPSGLQDYINLYLPAGESRNNLTSLLNDAIARSDRGEPGAAVVDSLVGFVRAAQGLRRQGTVTGRQVGTLVTLATVGIQVFLGRAENVSSAGFSPGAVAADSIATLLGEGFSATQASSTARPLPTTLAGVTVTVLDSAGTERLAPMFLASPGQINYLVPAGVAAGKATVIVSNGNRVTAVATLDIDPLSPGLFTAGTGGEAAAVVQRVKADGSQSFEIVTGPIDLGPETDQVFLLLFGTGIRGRSGLAGVTARVGSQGAGVTFAGPQSSFDGLDQVNVRLPRSSIGSGRVEIALSMDGWDANKVSVSIR